jgi:hypothetical protein
MCSFRFNHVVVVGSNESFKTLCVQLKSNTLICHIGVQLLVTGGTGNFS